MIDLKKVLRIACCLLITTGIWNKLVFSNQLISETTGWNSVNNHGWNHGKDVTRLPVKTPIFFAGFNSLSVPATSCSATPAGVCPGGSTTLGVIGGSLETGANWDWYSGSCGGTYLISGTQAVQIPAGATTYWVRAEGPSNTTTCVSITVTINSLSTAPSSANSTPQDISTGSSATLAVNGGSTGTGGTWNWYSGSCGGTYVTSGSSPAVTPTTTMTYYVRAESSCNTTTCASATVLYITPQNEIKWWRPNGNVNCIVNDTINNIVYLGGSFTSVNPYNPYGTLLSIATGYPDLTIDIPNGPVYSSIPDGLGGWYIGGSFTMVGDSLRNNIAHLNNLNHVDGWNPNSNNTVYSLALSGSIVYAGGSFTNIGSASRNYLAALNATTGAAMSWNPNANAIVRVIAINGTSVYVGGDFTSILSQSISYLAAMTNASFSPSITWNPNANGNVYSIAISTTTIYAGGNFTSMGTIPTTRNRIAAFSLSTGNLTTWNPGADTTVCSIVIKGLNVYVGGNFSLIDGQPRAYIAAIAISSGLPTTWNPSANSAVLSLLVNGSNVYAGGLFTNIGGQSRSLLAALDTTTGNAVAWNPVVTGTSILTISSFGTNLYVGGNFNFTGGTARNNIAALDGSTGIPKSWNPNAIGTSSSVNAMALNGNVLYAGGIFTSAGGQSRNNIAALDVVTGNATSWNPGANSTVRSIAVNGNNVYAGGDFTIIGSQSRNRIASIDAVMGTATGWNPNASSTVYTILINGNKVYAGGDFTSIGAATRKKIASFYLSTGNITAWNPNADSTVFSLAINSNIIYAGGYFSNIGGQPRNKIAALDTSGNAMSWNPNATGLVNPAVNSIAVNVNNVYAGGCFTGIGNQSRNNIAELDAVSGTSTFWAPNANACIQNMTIAKKILYIGGSFTQIFNKPVNYFAVYDIPATYSVPFGSATATPPIICPGIQTTLSMSGGGVLGIGATWKWYSGTCGGTYVTSGLSPVMTISATTIYYVRAEGTNNTTSCVSTTVTLATNPTSVAPVSAISSPACITTGVVSTLSLVGGSLGPLAQWSWYTGSCGGTYTTSGASPVVSPVTNTTYYIRGEGPCNTTSCVSVTVVFTQPVPETDWAQPNGQVNCILNDTVNNIVYLGGSFSSFTPNNQYGTLINVTTGYPDLTFANPNGPVLASVADGTGGWYIGGYFTMVGDSLRNNIAHISSNGKVLAWNPNVNDRVRCMDMYGSNIYFGGDFTSIGGVTRNRIGAVSSTTGLTTTWNPNANGIVIAINCYNSTTIYAGGAFTNIGGLQRNYIAALDASGNAKTSWNPNANNQVNAIVTNGNFLYAGGDFTFIGGSSANYLACLGITTSDTGSLYTTFNAGVSGGYVNALFVSGYLYVGGFFTSIGGQPYNYLAALNVTSGAVVSWNPNPLPTGSTVFSIARYGNNVYVGGTFTTIGGQPRNYFGAVNSSTGLATTWQPNCMGGPVMSLTLYGTYLYTGGNFSSIGMQYRNNIAAIDATTGLPTSWNPGANSSVNSLALKGSVVYAGGYFTSIGGQSRNYLAALDATTGNATTWNPTANSNVLALAVSGSKVYAGGSFSTMGTGGQLVVRNRIACLDSLGNPTSWNPNSNDIVRSIAVYGNKIYTGGDFTSIGGQSRNNIAAFSLSTGNITSWNPVTTGTSSNINLISFRNNNIYAGGNFTGIGGQSRNNIAALDSSSANASTLWNPNANGTINAIEPYGNYIYTGGNFSSIGGQTMGNIAMLDTVSGNPTTWNPNANNYISSLKCDKKKIYAGGAFTQISNKAISYFAVFAIPSVSPISANISSSLICNGTSVSLSILGGNLGGSANWKWYSVSCGGTYLNSGASVAETPVTSTVYYVRAESPTNTTNCLSTSVTVNSLSNSATACTSNPSTLCAGASSTMSFTGGSLGTGAGWRWYLNSCGGTFVSSAVAPVITPTVSSTYYIRAESTCNTTACMSTKIIVSTLSTLSSSQQWTIYDTTNSGLVQNYVTSIAADSLGTKWFGSPGGGVSTFNSFAWNAYNVLNSPLINNTVNCIVNDNTGIKWFGTAQGVSTFDGVHWASYTTANGLTNNYVLSMAVDGSGNKWFGTKGGVSKLNGTNWTNFTRSGGLLLQDTISSIVIDASGKIWFGGPRGISQLSGTTWTTYTTSSGLINNYIESISTDVSGNLWFGTTSGLSKFDGTNWTSYTSSNSGLANNDVTAISQDASLNMWFATSGGGVSKFDGVNWTTYNTSNGLSCNNVRNIKIDQNGIIWFGTSCDGVTKLVDVSHASSIPSSICAGASATLGITGGTAGSGAKWKWYTVSCGGTASGAGSTITQSPTVSTVYYVRAENLCNSTGCVSTTVSLSTVSSAASGATTVLSNICSGQPTTLGLNGGSLGTGGMWSWYSASCGVSYVTSGSNPVVSPSVTTTYYVRAEGACNMTLCVSVIVTLNSVSVAPSSITSSPSSICTGSSASLGISGGNLGTGAIWVWYSGSCGGTYASSGSQAIFSPANTTTYYVRAEGTCNTSTCSSSILVVNAISVASTGVIASPSALCPGSSSTLSVTGGSLGTGAIWTWYSGSCGGGYVTSGSAPVFSPSVTTTYFLRAEGTCNTTLCVNTIITLNTLSSAANSASANPTAICSGSSTSLSVNGGSPGTGGIWKWYTGSCGNSYAGSGAAPVFSPAVTSTYYVRFEGTCNTTTCVSVIVSVNTLSGQNISASVTPTVICSGQPSTASIISGSLGTGANWDWYSGSACGINYVGSGSSIIFIPTVSSTYYVRAEGLCNTTSCVSVTISVNSNSISVLPSSVSASPALICSGSLSIITENGGVLGTGAIWYWYTGGCGNSFLDVGNSTIQVPAVTTVYYVRAEGTCNTTSCISATVTVDSLSVAATGATSFSPILYGASTTLGITGGTLGNGANWNWYTGSCGATYVASGITPVLSPTVNTTYYVRAENICNTTICVSTMVVVNNTSVPPTSAAATPSSICSGLSSTLTFTGGSLGSGANWYWYSGGCGNNYAGIGTSLIQMPSITTTYYVRAEGPSNTTSCVSVTITVSTNTISIAPLTATATPSTICSGSYTTLTESGGTPGTSAIWKWYTGSCGGTLSGGGATSIQAPTISATYFIRAEGPCNTTTCASAYVNVNTASVAATGANANPSTICSGSSTTLGTQGGSTGAPGNWNWYTGSCGGTYIISGAMPTVSLTSSTTFYVRAEGACNTTSCVSVIVAVNTLSSSPSAITATSNTFCSGLSSTLGITGGSLGFGANWYWYTGSCGGSLLALGPSEVVSPSITTTYWVRAESNCNTTNCQSFNIIINSLSNPVTGISATPSSICSGSFSTLGITGGSLGTGANWYWYTGSCGEIFVNSGASPVLSPANTTVYWVRAEGSCNTAACASVAIKVTTLSTPPVSLLNSNPDVCLGFSSVLGIIGGSLGTNASWVWYTGSCGGTSFMTGDTITIYPSQTSTYWVRAENICNSTTCLSTNVTVHNLSTVPTSITTSTQVICAGNSSSITFSGGNIDVNGTWSWYVNSCGGIYYSSGTSIIVTPIVTTNYFIRAESLCNTTSCLSITITVNSQSSVAAQWTTFNTSNSSLPGNLAGVKIDASQNKWFITNGAGVAKYDGLSWTIYNTSNSGLPSNQVISVEIDPAGNKWFGTNGGGVAKFDGTNWTIFNTSNTNSGLAQNTVYSIKSDTSGNIWFGFLWSGGGVSKLHLNGMTWTNYNTSNSLLINNNIQAIAIDSAGNKWFGTNGSGVSKFDGVNWTTYTTTNGLASNYVKKIAFDKTGNIWFGTSSGVTKFDGQHNWTTYSSSNSGLVYNDIYEISFDKYGNEWFGTWGGGVSEFDGSNWVSFNSTTGLAENHVSYIQIDSLNYKWFGTLGGVSKYMEAVTATSSQPIICSGSSSTVGITGGSLGTGASWSWFSGSCSGTVLRTGLSMVVSPASTTVYYVRAAGICNTTACVSITITVNSVSVAPTSATASPSAICSGSSVTIGESGGILGTLASWYWYTGACGSSYLVSGLSAIITPSLTTKYYLRAEGTCNTTSCISVTVTVNTNSQPATSVAATLSVLCPGAQTVLNLSGGSPGSGGIWAWYSGSCGSTYLGTGISIVQTPSISTNYYIRAEGICNTTSCISKTITVNVASLPPSSASASPSVICQYSSSSLGLSGGSLGTQANWDWYLSSCGGTFLNSGITAGVSPTVTTTYWVRAEGSCNTTLCISITVTVILIPDAPTGASSVNGQPSTLNVSGNLSSGAVWTWYESGCGSETVVGTGFSITVSPTETTTYFVRAENGICFSNCVQTIINVAGSLNPPSSVSASPNVICPGNYSSLNLTGTLNGGQWFWYAGSCQGTYLGTGASISVSPSAQTNYYARQELTGVYSTCLFTTVSLNSLSVQANSATSSPPQICNGSSSTLGITGGSPGTAATWNWYAGSCGVGSMVGSGISPVVSPDSTTVYFVRAEGNCNTTLCESTTVSVFGFSTASTSATSTAYTICYGSSMTLGMTGGIAGIGSSWNWYSGTCGGSYVGSGISQVVIPDSSVTYYVRAEGMCNTTQCVSTAITVNTLSTQAISITSTNAEICYGSPATLSINGGSAGAGANWNWYSSSCGGTWLVSGISAVLSPSVTTEYFVRAENICNSTSCVSITITVNTFSVNADSAIATPSVICSASSATLSIAGGFLGTPANWYWYSGSCGNSLISSAFSVVISPSSTSEYFVRAEGECNTTICISVTLTVNIPSVAPTGLTFDHDTLCSGSLSDISITGGSAGTGGGWYWYSGYCGGSSAGTGVSISLSPMISTTYFVRAEGICNITTCLSITITVNEYSVTPDSVSATPGTICEGNFTFLSFSGGSLGTGANWYWYSGSCGGQIEGNGLSLTINPESTLSYFVRAEGVCNTTACIDITVTVSDSSISADYIDAPETTICMGGSSILLVDGGVAGAGANWYWYSGSCGGSFLGTGSTLIIHPLLTTGYFVRAEGECNTTSCSGTVISVIDTSVSATSVNANLISICHGNSTTLGVTGGSLGSGASWQWYSASCGGTPEGSGLTLVVSPQITTVYFVRAEGACNTTACVNSIITMNDSSVSASGISADLTDICEGSSTILSLTGGTLGTGADWFWYVGLCGGSSSGTGLSIQVSPQSTSQYFVRAEGRCNTTTCVSVYISVNDSSQISGLTINGNVTVCSGSSSTLSISGGVPGTGANWAWYDSACGGSFDGYGDTLIVTPLVATEYFIRAEGICNTTNCSSIMISVIAYPSQPDSIAGNTVAVPGDTEVYSVTNVEGVIYSWTAPSGWSGTSFSNSIVFVAGVNNGNISVIASNLCASSSPRTLYVLTGFSISGYFIYDGNASLPMDSVWVFCMQNGNIIDSTQADITGYYSFNNIQNGTYNIIARTHKPWQGVNATDAVKVKRHFAGSELFTSSLRLHAADVNLSLSINSTDAVKITRRFVGSDTSFTRGDWLFEKPTGGDTLAVSPNLNDTVVVSGNNVEQDFRALCTGDVNGSNLPDPGAKESPKIILNTSGIIRLKENENFEVPLNVNSDLAVGAISLILDYPSDLAKVTGIQLVTDPETNNLFYKIDDKEIRIGWFEDDNPLRLNKNGMLLFIKGKTSGDFKPGKVINFRSLNNSLSELADENGIPFDNLVINTFSIEHENVFDLNNQENNAYDEMNLYPNPANEILNIRYNVPNDGSVQIVLFDILGNEINRIVDKFQLRGTYVQKLDLSSIPSGIYTCKMMLNNGASIVKKIIITKH